MSGQAVGYIRVSTVEQNTESQQVLLQKIGVYKVFEEKISGKNTDRPQLKAMLEYVREGDTVYVKDLSRLARNTKDLLDIVEYLTQKGVALKSLKESIDTSSNFGKLMITFLAAIYEFERANLLERQRDGIAVAKLKGKYKGRKKVDKPANFDEVYKKWLNREIKSITAIRELKISEYAFYKFVKECGSRSGGGENVEFSPLQLNDGDVGAQGISLSTTGAKREKQCLHNLEI